MSEQRQASPDPDADASRRRVLSDRLSILVLALIAYLPLLRTKPGTVGADTKHYLYLDPQQLMSRAASVWDPSIGLGTVSHQNVGYLWPMGPWYRAMEAAGVSDWIAQRLWLGTLLFAAGTGVMFLMRHLGMRGLGASVAALSYMLSPYVLAYAARISAILLPWAGLPWLIAIFVLALRRGGWRYPALFALVVATIGSINASSLLFAALAVVLWVPYAVWHLQETDLRTAGRTMARIGALTFVTQVWWLVALLLSSAYGPPVLETTETFEAVSTSSLSSEVARSLGNWFFYGRDAVGPWVEASVPYTQEGWLMTISFVLPVVAFGAAAVVRWQHRAYFTTLIVVGAVIGIAAFPFDEPSPFGAFAKVLTDRSSLALALRNAQRAVPLLALGVAASLGSLVHAVGDRVPWGRILTAAPVSLLVVANIPALWSGLLVDENLQRPEELPTYLLDAADRLDTGDDGTRVLEVPGTDFAAYRFGNTVDPIFPGLIDRPWVGRESAPQGTEGAIDLVRAFDRRLQEGTFEPEALHPVARLMNAGDVMVRADLQTERYRTPRPAVLAEWFRTPPPGLTGPDQFGVGVTNQPSPALPLLDELALAADTDLAPPPAISIYGVSGVAPIVSTTLGTDQVVLSGGGDGIVDAAAAGLIDGRELLIYSGDLIDLPPALDGVVFDPTAHVIFTDTNRRQSQRFSTLRENTGYTETADEVPLRRDPADARINLFGSAADPDAEVVDGDPTSSVTVLAGVAAIRATSYGNTVTNIPEERPTAAFDGDTRTAWKTSAFGSPVGERIRIDFLESRDVSELTLLQPVTGDRNRFIESVTVRFFGDQDASIDLRLDETSREGRGQVFDLPTVRAEAIEIEITADSGGTRSDYVGLSAVGFAEIGIPGLRVDEAVRLPTDLVDRAGGHTGPLSVVLTRLRANPAEPVRADPEVAIERIFSLPTSPTGFSGHVIGGSLRLNATMSDDRIDALLGLRGADDSGVTAQSSSRLPGSLAARASSALDGDPDTAWTPAFGPQAGQFVRFEFGRVVTTEHLDLQVIADQRHSVPRRLRLTNEAGEEVRVNVPEITSLPTPGARQTVRIDLPSAFSFQILRVTVDEVEAFTTTDYFARTQIELPVGVAELGLSRGEIVKPAPDELDDRCRSGLVRVDGADIEVRITGTTAAAIARDGLDFEACAANVDLDAGEHRVSATPGSESGLDLDRIVIRRVVPDEAAETPTSDVRPTIRSTRSSRSSHELLIRGADEPFFVVLGESFSDAWSARVDGGDDPGAPIRVNGFATAWRIDPAVSDPDGDGTIEMTLAWSPQRWASRAQVFSLVGALVCLLLVVVGGRVRNDERETVLPAALAPVPEIAFAWDHPGRAIQLVPTVSLSLVVGILGALFIGPTVGPLLACVAIVMGLKPSVRALLPIGATASLALAGALTVAVQMWKQYPPGFGWAANYDLLHPLGWIAFALLALDTGLEIVAARSAPPREVREPAS